VESSFKPMIRFHNVENYTTYHNSAAAGIGIMECEV